MASVWGGGPKLVISSNVYSGVEPGCSSAGLDSWLCGCCAPDLAQVLPLNKSIHLCDC